jgi:hypothetical protein
MTIGGVEALAAEVGIKPDLVRQAAQEVGRRSTPPAAPSRITPNRWIAGPTRIYTERVVDVEVPESEFPVMVEEIRRILQNVGQVNQLGRSFSWVTARHASTRRDLEVAVSVRGGRTRITIQENLAPVIGGVFGGIGGGMGGGGMGPIMGILGGALHLGPAVALVVPFWLGATYITARTVYRNITTKRVRELENLGDRLAEFAQDIVPDPRALPRGR